MHKGRRVKRKVEEYEYDPALESAYRSSMFKLFNKTLDEGYFSLVVVDAINSKVRLSVEGLLIMVAFKGC